MSTPTREPFDAFTPLRDAVNRFFDDGFMIPERIMTGRMIPVDVIEAADEYRIEASLAGVKPENVQVTTAGNTITIRVGHKPQRLEEEGTYLRRERLERHLPEMIRTIPLPTKIDSERIVADYQQGVLVIHVAKDEQAKPKAIPLHVAGQ